MTFILLKMICHIDIPIRVYARIALFAVLFAVCSCVPVQEYFPPKQVKYADLQIVASTSETTKIEIAGGSTGASTGTTSLVWSVNDSIGVYGIPVDDYGNELPNSTDRVINMKYRVIETAPTAVATFTPMGKTSTVGADNFVAGVRYNIYAYFPYNIQNDASNAHAIKLRVPMVQAAYIDADGNPTTKNVGISGFYHATDQVVVGAESAYLSFQATFPILEFVCNTTTITSNYHNKDTTFVLWNGDQPVNPIYSINFGEDFPYEEMSMLSIAEATVDMNPLNRTTNEVVITETYGRPQVAVTAVDASGELTYMRKGQTAQVMINPKAGTKPENLKLTVRLQNGEIIESRTGLDYPTGGFQRGKKYVHVLPETVTGAVEQYDDISLVGRHRANTYVIPAPNGDPVIAAHQYGFPIHVEGNSSHLTGYTVDSVLVDKNPQWKFKDLTVIWPVVVCEEGYTTEGVKTNDVLDGTIEYQGIYFVVKIKQNIKSARLVIGALNGVKELSSSTVDDYKPMWTWTLMVAHDAVETSPHYYELPTQDVVTQEGTIRFMNRNLGAFEAYSAETVASAANIELYRGFLYQWGRAVPLRSDKASYMYFQDFTDAALDSNREPCRYVNTQTTKKVFDLNKFVPSARNTKAPAVREVYNAIYTANAAAWDGLRGDASWQDGGSDKPMDDPCPWGYRVPTAAQLSAAFPTGNSYAIPDGETPVVYKNGNVYFPVSGICDVRRDDSSPPVVDANSLYWSSTTSGSYASNLLFKGTSALGTGGAGVGPDNYVSSSSSKVLRAGLGAIRCVKFVEPITDDVVHYF